MTNAAAALCSGTGGGFFPGTAAVPNTNAVDEAAAAAAGNAEVTANAAGQVLVRFNAATVPSPGPSPNAPGNAAATLANPCVAVGVPAKPSDTTPAWNVVGTTTGMGCCVPPGASSMQPGTPNNRVTRLTAFSTASAPGAPNAANLKGGIPLDLIAISKAWGIKSYAQLQKVVASGNAGTTYFLHNGTDASNVGLWTGNFTVKYKGQTWQQDRMLWCRQTGDNYKPELDPFGGPGAAPAGAGTFINDDPEVVAQRRIAACKTCDAGVITGSTAAAAAAACEPGGTPYFQTCDTDHVTADIMNLYQEIAALSHTAGTAQSTAPATVQSRCGGCFATRDQYGPGSFAVLANLPPTALLPGSDADGSPLVLPTSPPLYVNALGQYGAAKVPNPVPTNTVPTAANLTQGARGGRGYVFALWTFNYTEAYPAPNSPAGQPWPYGMVGGPAATSAANAAGVTAPGGTQVEAGAAGITGTKLMNVDAAASVDWWATAGQGTVAAGDSDDGFYTIHNHEIDIEIPANSAQAYTGLPGDVGPGMNTANYNTWLTDIGDYDPGTGALYQQVQSTLPTGQFYAAVGPDDDDDTFHEYKFVWVVDPADAAAAETAANTPDAAASAATESAGTYVAFFLDGVEQWRTHRFVPRRSGRVIFGLWPGWWGTNHGPMSFNHVYAKIARVDFVPQVNAEGAWQASAVTNAPQMYDQLLPTGRDIACGFETPIPPSNRRGIPVPWADGSSGSAFPASGFPPSKSATSHMPPWWVWVLVGVAVVVIIGGVAGGVLAKRKARNVK